MPRPQIPRCLAADFPVRLFKPAGVPGRDLERLSLTRDELEAFRLVDGDGLLQEIAALQMGISRPTLSRIVNEARRKAALALSRGWALAIETGNTHVSAGGSSMIVAVPVQGNTVETHWGHAPAIALYRGAASEAVPYQLLSTDQGCACKSGLARTLHEHGVTHVLVGSIGAGAHSALQRHGIQVVRGVTGAAHQAVVSLAAGSLADKPELCNHEECGEHGFGLMKP